jgi:hypothetical protein
MTHDLVTGAGRHVCTEAILRLPGGGQSKPGGLKYQQRGPENHGIVPGRPVLDGRKDLKMPDETAIRLSAFQWLRDREKWNDGIFLGQELNEGFQYQGRRITLKGQTGIWFPAGFTLPISITTAIKGPYDLDDIGDDGLLVYAYRGTDANHRDNRGLREAMRTRTPLIYFKEVHSHRYQAISG